MGWLDDVFGKIKGALGSVTGVLKYSSYITKVIGFLPDMIQDLLGIAEKGKKDLVDDALKQLDNFLGKESTALIDLDKDLPDDKEEELTDAMIKIVKIIAYNKLKVDGYYKEEE